LNRKLLLSLLSGLLLTLTVVAQPTVVISPSSGSGCSPLIISFTSTVTGGVAPYTYQWNFGPTVAPPLSTAASTPAVFTVAGTYTVTLTVTDANNAVGTAQPVTIIVNPTPIASFTAAPTSGCFPLNVQFTSTSTSGGSGATIMSYNWTFGDGKTGNQPSVSHTYTSAGLPPTFGFPVTLQVTNNLGCSGSTGFKTNSGYIIVPNGIVPNFSDSLSVSCSPKAFFTSTTNGGAPGLTYLWEFGDGNSSGPSPSPTASHTYANPGTDTVTMVVSSTAGCVDSFKRAIFIPNGGVHSDFTFPPTVCVSAPVTFTNLSTPNPTSSSWSFAGGNPVSYVGNPPPQVTYSAIGSYFVQLINTFPLCNDTVVKTITVVTGATANFTATSPTTSCKAPLTVNFKDLSTGSPTSWAWDFGDGNTLSGNNPLVDQNPSHTYTIPGVFNVKLTVSAGGSCAGSITLNQFVKISAPTVQVTNLPAFGCGSLIFTPTLVDSAVDGIASYAWNLGAGHGTSNQQIPPAQNYLPGGYLVSVTITTNGGCMASFADSIKVGTVKPAAAFSTIPAAPAIICTNTTVQFNDASTPVGSYEYIWNFGDGSVISGYTAAQKNPTHTYTAPGIYQVMEIVSNNGCADSVTHTVTVTGPSVNFTYTFNCANQSQFTFTDHTGGTIVSESWKFGDGHTAMGSPVMNNYAASGSYNVVLTVTDGNSCVNSDSMTIVANQNLSFSAISNPDCKNVGVEFNTINYTNYDSLYMFYFGDGDSTGPIRGASPIHIYTQAGMYTPKLVVLTTNLCLDTFTIATPVTINGPTAAFTVVDTTGCTSLPTQFTDQSTTDPFGHGIVTRVWNFGDGTIVTNPPAPVSHTYTIQGVYTVTLKVTDATGCSDSAMHVNSVTLSVPQARFSGGDSSCPGAQIQFNNASTGGFNPTYLWYLQPGPPVAGPNPPLISYGANGTYIDSVVMTDMYGCTSTAYDTITVGTPLALFITDTSSGSCPPLEVKFTYTGGPYYNSIEWLFGDGGVAYNTLNPINYYSKPGTDMAKLIVTAPGGCTSIDSLPISIFGPTGQLNYSPLEGCDSVVVNLNVTASNVVNYIWVYGDNTTLGPVTSSTETHTYYPPAPGQLAKYFPGVILEDPNGCFVAQFGDSLSDSVLAVGILPAFSMSNKFFCDSGTVQFTDMTWSNDTITSYLWTFGDGTTAGPGMIPAISHDYTTPGLYQPYLTVTTKFGCSQQQLVDSTVKVVPSPQATITGDISQCVPATLTLQGNPTFVDTSTASWKWLWNYFPGSATGMTPNPQPATYTKAGLYFTQLTLTNLSGCSTIIMDSVFVYPLPTLMVTPDTTICLGQNLPLLVSGAVNYVWTPPATLANPNTNAPVATPTITTTYDVTGTDANGCVSTDSVIVTVNQPVTVSVASASDSVCLGQSVQLIASGAALYTWTPAAGLNNASIADPVATPSTTTDYQVTGSDNKLCFFDTKNVEVTVFNYPTLTLSANTQILVGSSYQIAGTGSPDIVSLNWLPVTGLSCTNCLSPLATPQSTTTYVLTAVNNGGCSVSDSITIQVVCNNNNFFIPNTFSPNGDGVNDVFYVRGTGLNTIPSMTIFNRYGQIVFQKRDFAANDPAAGWDGTINGKPAPVDVYVYTVDIICDNSTLIPYHGNVALIR
jgi:gliding motility-associated-like protein